MTEFELFPKDKTIGIFRGFTDGGLEFRADIVLPYKNDFQTIPMHGQFLLVQLENSNEAVLGRIISLSSEGKLSYGSGEEFNIRAIQEEREIPDDLRRNYLRYSVGIRVLGVIRKQNNKIEFAPSHRRLPHMGSLVAFLSDNILKEIVGHNIEGAAIGHFALGEFVYCGNDSRTELEVWMQACQPEICVNFPISHLVSRRSFIFARAGFGKSNLNKLLFSTLYKETPTVEKHGRHVPVGTVIFDPDGEYFWPDDKGRPGLCDVPHLQDKLVVFTGREGPSPFYHSFVAGNIKLDIRTLPPADVVAIALSPELQDQQNVKKLKGLSLDKWEKLITLIDANGYATPLEDISEILHLNKTQEMEALSARSHMTHIVKMLHDKSSQLMEMLMYSLKLGKLCVIDISQMRGKQSLILSGLILRKIFNRNQDEFTKANAATIPTIAVVEEAQSVLNEKASGSAPYIEWVKEGRKYDLGVMLVTQQPGSIPVEILSQGDNWFIFHLLSAADLSSLKSANAHFSQDILSSLLNEPISGQGIFWSSVGEKKYPISLRVCSFNKMYTADKAYKRNKGLTFAKSLKEQFKKSAQITTPASPAIEENFRSSDDMDVDFHAELEANLIIALKRDDAFMEKVGDEPGIAWGELQGIIYRLLPEIIDEKNNKAYTLLPKVMNGIFGLQKEGWQSYKHGEKTYVKRIKK